MENKVAIITGAASGIGQACFDLFIKSGYLVTAIDMDETKLLEVSCDYDPNKVLLVAANVTHYCKLKRAIEQTVAKFGRIDCLINNAGVHPPATSIEEFSVQDFEKNVAINLTSNYALCQYTVPYLEQTNGTIVFITSMVAIVGQDHAAAYCASKAGQIGLTKALAIELAPKIRVNAIAPSNVETQAMTNWLNTLPDPALAKENISNVQVLKRMAQPIEMANIALFLASDKASFLTGQVIQADGGACLGY